MFRTSGTSLNLTFGWKCNVTPFITNPCQAPGRFLLCVIDSFYENPKKLFFSVYTNILFINNFLFPTLFTFFLSFYFLSTQLSTRMAYHERNSFNLITINSVTWIVWNFEFLFDETNDEKSTDTTCIEGFFMNLIIVIWFCFLRTLKRHEIQVSR